MMATTTFAIADLHGRYDLLLMALGAIAERAKSGDTIVFLGDYIDRGPQSASIVALLMAGPESISGLDGGIRWICLQGNHESMMLSCLSNPAAVQWWARNGGVETLRSYGHPVPWTFLPHVIPAAHVDWLSALPTLHVDRHRIYVHAGVNPTKSLDEQMRHDLQWMLYPDGFEGGHGDRHVVHGHHQFADGPKLYAGRTDLDTFAFATGRLVVGVFDDNLPGGPVDLIEVIGKTDMRWLTGVA